MSWKMLEKCSSTLISGADATGHGGTCPHAPHFYKSLRTGGTVSRSTANKKLTKLYWPQRKRSIKTTNCAIRAKKWRGM